LLLLGDARPDERATIFFQQLEYSLFDRRFTKLCILLAAADYLATQHPQMVAVTAQCAGGKFFGQQVQQEGLEELDDEVARSQVTLFI